GVEAPPGGGAGRWRGVLWAGGGGPDRDRQPAGRRRRPVLADGVRRRAGVRQGAARLRLPGAEPPGPERPSLRVSLDAVRRRRVLMGILIVALALFAGYGTAYLASEDVRYLTRAGLEQTRILQRRKPLEQLVADPTLPAAERAWLHLVLEVRAHAVQLGLDADQTYTTYTDVGRDTLLLSLTASRKDCICPVTWKYPIVGRVPYKGFFDPAMAQREADRLAAKGFDVSLRPAAAYSTLGWFNDPLLSTALVRDSVELAA